MKKQILAGVLSATMIVGMGGVSVFAADGADDKTYNIGICQLVRFPIVFFIFSSNDFNLSFIVLSPFICLSAFLYSYFCSCKCTLHCLNNAVLLI